MAYLRNRGAGDARARALSRGHSIRGISEFATEQAWSDYPLRVPMNCYERSFFRKIWAFYKRSASLKSNVQQKSTHPSKIFFKNHNTVQLWERSPERLPKLLMKLRNKNHVLQSSSFLHKKTHFNAK